MELASNHLSVRWLRPSRGSWHIPYSEVESVAPFRSKLPSLITANGRLTPTVILRLTVKRPLWRRFVRRYDLSIPPEDAPLFMAEVSERIQRA